jgi:hypothetical protein
MATTTTPTMSTTDQAALKAAGDAYNAAKASGDTAGMNAAHAAAEAVRANYNFSGGANGSANIPTNQQTSAAAPSSGAAYVPKGTYFDAGVTDAADQAALKAAGDAYNAAAAANDEAGKAKAHAAAEAIRAKYKYSGLTDGSDYDPFGQQNQQQSTGYQTKSAPDYLSEMKGLLDEWLSAAQTQSGNKIDYATQQSITELQRAMDDAQGEFQTERNQVATAEQKALDNSALYAEARGDKGGIGQEQYNVIQANAAKSQQAVSAAQVQLSTDTARQISDLRAKGEFEKADQLLEVSQTYLSQLIELQKWQAEYNLDYDQFQESIREWQNEYELKVADLTGTYNGSPTYEASQDTQSQLSSIGGTLLDAGIMPSDEQLAALGMTKGQAQQYITAAQLAAAAKSSSKSSNSGSGKSTSTSTSTSKSTSTSTATAKADSSLPTSLKGTSASTQTIYKTAVAQSGGNLFKAQSIASYMYDNLDAAEKPTKAEYDALIKALINSAALHQTPTAEESTANSESLAAAQKALAAEKLKNSAVNKNYTAPTMLNMPI